jgi:hypothetical protein
VVLESTGNELAITRILQTHAEEVVLANPMHVRAISHAKVKNDRLDARTLAELRAADLVPRVWISDEKTRLLRHLTSMCIQLYMACLSRFLSGSASHARGSLVRSGNRMQFGPG